MMSERVPIQQAIADERAIAEAARKSRLPQHVDVAWKVLERVQSGEIVTAERAALETMAEQPCQDISGELCEITMPGDPVHWCHPCGCRHALEATA